MCVPAVYHSILEAKTRILVGEIKTCENYPTASFKPLAINATASTGHATPHHCDGKSHLPFGTTSSDRKNRSTTTGTVAVSSEKSRPEELSDFHPNVRFRS